jgi:hypothetical protein
LLDYIDDLDADFRVFYRIDGLADGNYGDLSGPRFLRLAFRTIHYRGVMRDRVMIENEKNEREPGSTPRSEIRRDVSHASAPGGTSSMWSGEVKEVPLSQMQVLHPGIIEHQVV